MMPTRERTMMSHPSYLYREIPRQPSSLYTPLTLVIAGLWGVQAGSRAW
jgi:hypothetical protein